MEHGSQPTQLHNRQVNCRKGDDWARGLGPIDQSLDSSRMHQPEKIVGRGLLDRVAVGQDLEPAGQRDSIGEERLALKDLVDQSLRTTCEVTVSERTLHAVSTK